MSADSEIKLLAEGLCLRIKEDPDFKKAVKSMLDRSPKYLKTKRNLRVKEDELRYQMSPGIYGDHPCSVEELPITINDLLEQCELELESYNPDEIFFRIPAVEADATEKNRDISDAFLLTRSIRKKIEADDQPSLTLELFRLARILERLRVLDEVNPPPRTATVDSYLKSKVHEAWHQLGGAESNPTFHEVYSRLKSLGITRCSKSDRVQWREPTKRGSQSKSVGRLRNLYTEWRKEWLKQAE